MTAITREEAINEVGLALVEKVEAEGVEFTNRVTDGTRHNGYTEFSASVDLDEDDGFKSKLTMFVYVDSDTVSETEALDQIDWDAAIAEAEYRVE